MPREQLYLLTVNMAGERGESIPWICLCRTRQAALQRLAEWVDDQDRELMTDEEYAERGPDLDKRIDEYFATSEDAFHIDEMEVIEEKADAS